MESRREEERQTMYLSIDEAREIQTYSTDDEVIVPREYMDALVIVGDEEFYVNEIDLRHV